MYRPFAIFRIPKLTPRLCLAVVHDLLAAAVALFGSFYLRFDWVGLQNGAGMLLRILPFFLLWAAFTYFFLGLYQSKWRFTSLPDMFTILRVVAVTNVSLVVLDYVLVAPNVYGSFFFGKTTIIICALLQTAILSGSRLVYRSLRHGRMRRHPANLNAAPTLALGRAADADGLLRAIEGGSIRQIRVVAILSPSPSDHGLTLRGVRVVGSLDDLERIAADFAGRGTPIKRVIFLPTAMRADARPEEVLPRARRLNMIPSRLPGLDEGASLELTPINVDDLLVRPTVEIDYDRISGAMAGQSVIVTGGGGSIGAEICRRVASFGAARLLIIDSSETALYAISEELSHAGTSCEIECRIADIRDRTRIFDLFRAFRPDLVFHSAALKHVPILERDWAEGIKTNIFGSCNVADASVAVAANAMVMISTDKAVRPISVLGTTKRLAEMYCQSLDANLRVPVASATSTRRTRLITVRFGNVLASNGSVVPKFRAQIESGGPVTVTHPEMVRYFMTMREACDLVITAASHAFSRDAANFPVYVLDMGQPVSIADLAERMIRLSGLEPGVDIEIVFTGMRPGERLREQLFADMEPTIDVGVPGISAAEPSFPPLEQIRVRFKELQEALEKGDRDTAIRVLKGATAASDGSDPVAQLRLVAAEEALRRA